MKKYKVKALDGEDAVVCRDDAGRMVCSVCGLAYEDSQNWLPEVFVVDLDTCPCCYVQFGFDDLGPYPPDPSNPIMRRWAKLRIQWLEREGWPGWALERLEKNLELSQEQLIKDRDEFAGE